MKQLEDKINENKLNSQEKEFCHKVKTLYIINKKKANCTIDELFDWVKEMVSQSQQMILIDPPSGVNVGGVSLKGISGTQRSSNNKSSAKIEKPKDNVTLAKKSSRQ